MSDTPETDELYNAGLSKGIYVSVTSSDWADLCRKLERERNALRELSLQLAKELVSKCNDPVHRQQVAELHNVDDYFKYRPQTPCASDFLNCQPPTEH